MIEGMQKIPQTCAGGKGNLMAARALTDGQYRHRLHLNRVNRGQNSTMPKKVTVSGPLIYLSGVFFVVWYTSMP